METLAEAAHTAAGGPEKEIPAQEDAAGEEPDGTPDRRHVDALLDISEEEFLKELEPYEYHCYSGWEEAVQGWTRVAPMSCILLAQKRYRKQRPKEADNPPPLSIGLKNPNAHSSASIAEHRCESELIQHNGFKNSMPLNQHTGSWSNTAALQKDVPVPNAMQKTTSNILLEVKIEEEGRLGETPLQNKSTKTQKHSHRQNNTVVPIKNFTFLPPIETPHLNPQRVSGMKSSDGETIEEDCFLFDKKSRRRGTNVDPPANPGLPVYTAGLTSKYRTCQHNPLLFSAVSVSIPRRYQVPLSTKHDTVHRTGFSMDKSLTQAFHPGAAAGAQVPMRPSKTVCAVKLCEGCEINV